MKEFPQFLSRDLEKVDSIISRSISSEVEKVSLVSDYIINSGGKRIRPILAILSAHLFDPKDEKYLHIASAVEFIHTATLLHDDVIDESATRRGKQTANLKWSNQLAILVGDFLFTQSFKQMVMTESLEVMATLSKASSVIAEGEVDQLENIGNLSTTYEQYLKVISSKTSELFAASCKCGGVITSQDQAKNQALYEFGVNLGNAFQIIDDILDYTSKDTGKDLGNDLQERKVTIPIIKVLNKLSYEEKKIFEQAFTNEESVADFKTIKSMIERYDGFGESQKIAQQYSDKALKILNKFPASEAQKAFKSIILEQLERVS